jgi:hypothetical protein
LQSSIIEGFYYHHLFVAATVIVWKHLLAYKVKIVEMVHFSKVQQRSDAADAHSEKECERRGFKTYFTAMSMIIADDTKDTQRK